MMARSKQSLLTAFHSLRASVHPEESRKESPPSLYSVAEPHFTATEAPFRLPNPCQVLSSH